MHILLIRHAETDGNRTRYVGREDLGLNQTGQRQAEMLADQLCGHAITGILSSPLMRARQTAAPLARRLGVDVELREGLTEFDFGALEGRPKEQTNLSLKRHHRYDPVEGGESLRDVWQRLEARCGRIAQAQWGGGTRGRRWALLDQPSAVRPDPRYSFHTGVEGIHIQACQCFRGPLRTRPSGSS